MAILRIDHVQLAMPVGGEDRARSFYAGLLGLGETPKPAALAGRGGCWFEQPGLRIHLGVEQDFRPARKAHIALVTDDLRGLAASLAQNGCHIVDGEPFDGCERRFVDDPFGNRIELIQPPS